MEENTRVFSMQLVKVMKLANKCWFFCFVSRYQYPMSNLIQYKQIGPNQTQILLLIK